MPEHLSCCGMNSRLNQERIAPGFISAAPPECATCCCPLVEALSAERMAGELGSMRARNGIENRSVSTVA